MSKFRHQPDFVVDRLLVQDQPDRRVHIRYLSNVHQCWIGWWHDEASKIVTGVIRDISQSGVKIELKQEIPEKAPVWFCPKQSRSARWLRADVVRVSGRGWLQSLLGKPLDVGLQFLEPCTWETLRPALFGMSESTRMEPVPPPLPRPGGSEL